LVTTRVVICVRSMALATRIRVRVDRLDAAATRESAECISWAELDAKSRLVFCQLLVLPDDDELEYPAETPPPPTMAPRIPVDAVAATLSVLLSDRILLPPLAASSNADWKVARADASSVSVNVCRSSALIASISRSLADWRVSWMAILCCSPG